MALGSQRLMVTSLQDAGFKLHELTSVFLGTSQQNLMVLMNKNVPAPRLVGIAENPGPRRSQRLSEEERWRVIFLSTELHLSTRRIAKRMKISPTTVTNILKKYHETGSTKDRPRRGPKRKILNDDEKWMIRKAKRGKYVPEIAIDYESKTGKTITDEAVRKVLHAHGLKYRSVKEIPTLSPQNKVKRLQYANRMKRYKWKNVLFSDEKTFPLGRGVSHCWQAPGNRISRQVSRHPPKLNVWGAAGYYVKSKLYFFTGNLTAKLYQRIVKARLIEKRLSYAPDCPPRLPGKWAFLQDNVSTHKTSSTMATLETLVSDRIIDHPPESPDLNIMEDLWAYLDHKVKAAKVKTIQGLKLKLTREWEDMDWKEIRASVGSLPARLTECRNAQGGRTHY
jgi:transposase